MGDSLIGLGVMAIYGALLSKVFRKDPLAPPPVSPPTPPRASSAPEEDTGTVIPANADLAATLRRNANGKAADVIDAEDV